MHDEDLAARAAAVTRDALDRHGGYGAGVALAVGGRPVLAAGIGWRDRGRTVPLEPEPLGWIWSITKPLYAMVALRFAERGLLTLDDPLDRFLPEHRLGPEITIRRVLNHTSGLPDYGSMPEYQAAVRADPGRPWDEATFLDRTLRARGLLFPPGAGWAYSNIGYMLLRRALERANGRPMRAILAAEIFAPLGLAGATLAEGPGDLRDLAPGWSTALGPAGQESDVSRRYHPGWVSHGAVVATAAEVVTIIDALFAGRLVGPGSLEQMLEPVRLSFRHPLFGEAGYALGLCVGLDQSLVGHGGEGPGFSAGVLRLGQPSGPTVIAAAIANRDVPDLGLEIAHAMAAVATRPAAT